MFIFKEEHAEELLAANDWALFHEMMAPNTGPEAMAEYLAAYSKPGLMSKCEAIFPFPLPTFPSRRNLPWSKENLHLCVRPVAWPVRNMVSEGFTQSFLLLLRWAPALEIRMRCSAAHLPREFLVAGDVCH